MARDRNTETRATFTLEPQAAQHAAAMFPLLADTTLYAYVDQPPPASEAALRERFARLESRQSPDGSQQWLNWVIRLQNGLPNGDLAGYVQATVYADASANIAYVLGSAFMGRGLARQAVVQMLDMLANQHAVQLAFATVDERNTRSLRLLHALGFAEANATGLSGHPTPQPGDVLLTRPLRTGPR